MLITKEINFDTVSSLLNEAKQKYNNFVVSVSFESMRVDDLTEFENVKMDGYYPIRFIFNSTEINSRLVVNLIDTIPFWLNYQEE